MPFPKLLVAKTLQRRHEEYAKRINFWETVTDFYEGGESVETKKAKYLPRMSDEQEGTHKDRLAAASYINYLGQVIDYFTSALFGQQLTVKQPADAENAATAGDAAGDGDGDADEYAALERDADLQGTPFAEVEKDLFRTAILKRRALLALDFPTAAEAEILSRAEEEEFGTGRPYLYEVPVEELTNWKRLPRAAGFEWCLLYCCRTPELGPLDSTDIIQIHEWKIWQLTADGFAEWGLYRFEERKGEPLKDETEISLSGEDVTTFRSIPLVELEMPHGLWIGNKILGPCREHFVRRSCLIAAEHKSLYAIPVAKLGDALRGDGSIQAEITENEQRGNDPVGQAKRKGYVVLGKEDSLEFAEPTGSAYTVVDTQLKELVDDIYRIVHQMAASVTNTTTAIGRSGASKSADMAATSVVLTEYGRRVRTHARRVFDIFSAARKEKILWNVHGLEKYELRDRTELLAEATQVDNIRIPSKTWKQEYKTQVALNLLPNAEPATQELIRQEIKDGVVAEEQLRVLAQDAEKEFIENPPPPPPAMPAPGAKLPAPKSKSQQKAE